jgi:hypothetical protein
MTGVFEIAFVGRERLAWAEALPLVNHDNGGLIINRIA